MDYQVQRDIESVIEILGMTKEDFAAELGVTRATLSNWLNSRANITPRHISEFYEYCFKRGIRLNKIKEQLYREDMLKDDDVLLFHGAKNEIIGKLDLNHNKGINDFGRGFYCGESLEQSAMFVSTYKQSSLYMLKFTPKRLKKKEYKVDREWMLMIAYYRERLGDLANSEIIKALVRSASKIDYIVAPIADNKMFEIIDSFIDGEITDVQCQHCLSATNLGRQYVFVSQKAMDNIIILERCFLADSEKEFYLKSRQENFQMNMDKVKLARRQYRNQGNYIEDILK